MDDTDLEEWSGGSVHLPPLALQVECFRLGGRRVEVVEVLDRWLDPVHRYYKVRGDDGGIYLICHDVPLAWWELTLYDSGTRPDTRLSST